MISEEMMKTRIATLNTIQEAIFLATDQLSSTTPRVDAELLLAAVLNVSRNYCYTHPDQALTAEQQSDFQALIERRIKGEPIAYIIGKKAFWQHDFMVTPATLIPRPETEMLVEILLRELPTESELQLADLGTGSGAIALSLAKERPHWQITATDFCQEALLVAKENATRLEVENVRFSQGSWCLALPQQSYHAIVANPPYIAAEDPHLSWGDLRFEPKTALVSGPDGLSAIREIATNAGDYLYNGGYLVLEHGYDQAEAVRKLLEDCGFVRVHSERDLSGHERVTIGSWQS